ncbi:type II toxin-antitoxin system RatA family toxin [Henriciella litoralis]|uniref:type II toxin-antitoxin system RatA family toxin n=1 Tax=Henriciella litoralis TaxID=568102 RepID=UPI000A01E87E|nr:type II toxin-antitoxin system RatA family toxin [Henriciella litoralis]
MPSLKRQVKIPYHADDVFDLVADISRYPEFIRWIKKMKVSGIAHSGPVRTYRGEADVGFKGFSERFSTDIRADTEVRTVDVSLARGPFKKLKNSWKMKPDGQGQTDIEFFIDYEFKNPVLSLLARANTNLAVSKIMQAFQDEAKRRFGKPSA